MKTLQDLGDLKGKRVLMRADFNVPLDGTTITDDGRIKAALPIITPLSEEGAVILIAPSYRPKGKVVPELSLARSPSCLGELLGVESLLAKDTYGEDAQAKVAAMNDGDVVLLENVRFNRRRPARIPPCAPRTPRRSPPSARSCPDGFGVSIAPRVRLRCGRRFAWPPRQLVEKEVTLLSKATENPERLFTVVLGGSKVSDKLGVIENLLDKANRLVIGGGMVFTFLKAKGYEVGTSPARRVTSSTRSRATSLPPRRTASSFVLPTDVVVNAGFLLVTPRSPRGRCRRCHPDRQDLA